MFYQYLFESLGKQQLRGILLNIYVFNLINYTKLCSLLATFVNTQETFQRGLNVVVRVIWRRDVGQCQINVETTFCMSTLKFTTLNNVKSTLSISALILTTSENVETMLLFSTSSFIALINVEKTWIWPFSKSWKEKINIFESQKKEGSHLINSIHFWLWSIKKKGKYGTYNVKINVWKHNACYMKRIWK